VILVATATAAANRYRKRATLVGIRSAIEVCPRTAATEAAAVMVAAAAAAAAAIRKLIGSHP